MPNTTRSPFAQHQDGAGLRFLVDTRYAPGSVFWVHSGTGTDSVGRGQTPDQPLATLDYAIGLCTASKGDLILVLPGHAETLAADIDLDVIGVTIQGLGHGALRPTLTLGAVGVKLDVDAASCAVRNLLFVVGADDVTAAIDVDGADCLLEDVELREGAGADQQALVYIDLGADRATVKNCRIRSVTAGSNSGIKVSAAKDEIRVEGCEVFGDFADAAVHNPTGSVATRLKVHGNWLTNLQSGDHAIELVSACTGTITRNYVNSTLAAAGTAGAIDQGACYVAENWGVDATADVSGILNPVLDA